MVVVFTFDTSSFGYIFILVVLYISDNAAGKASVRVLSRVLSLYNETSFVRVFIVKRKSLQAKQGLVIYAFCDRDVLPVEVSASEDQLIVVCCVLSVLGKD